MSTNLPQTMWDDKFASSEFFYGTEANVFLVQQAQQLSANSEVLCLAEGEGRNAVYLAAQGHRVSALDYSSAGIEKTKKLAAQRQVRVVTVLQDLAEWQPDANSVDAIVAIFMHLPSPLRQQVLANIVKALRPGGVFIGEFYRPEQLAYNTGGPKDRALLYTQEMLANDLSGLNFGHLANTEREVIEGIGHTGKAAVVQVVARKST